MNRPSSGVLFGGSSPRERGARSCICRDRFLVRLIPARAGSTRVSEMSIRKPSAHPRASGEHRVAVPSGLPLSGSSPRERGAHGLRPVLGPLRLAHPRASGEHQVDPEPGPQGAGSSPRERGARTLPGLTSRVSRLIPARAGSTSSATGRRQPTPAHPRASGEHAGRRGGGLMSDGSSPRERGARGLAVAVGCDRRLIPARAGSTAGPSARERGTTAHPRASGEHARCLQRRRESYGSSPRERGAPTSTTAGRT